MKPISKQEKQRRLEIARKASADYLSKKETFALAIARPVKLLSLKP